MKMTRQSHKTIIKGQKVSTIKKPLWNAISFPVQKSMKSPEIDFGRLSCPLKRKRNPTAIPESQVSAHEMEGRKLTPIRMSRERYSLIFLIHVVLLLQEK